MWDNIKNLLGKSAPLLGSALGIPGGAAIGSMIASALGVENEPDKIERALRADPEAAIKMQALQNEHARELRRMILESETTRLVQINKTYRKEIDSEDPYVRRARPTFLYVIAFSIAIEVIVALIVVFTDRSLEHLATLYQALAIPQGIAAGMCGVYLKQRSNDKMVKAGMQPKGLLEGLLGNRNV